MKDLGDATYILGIKIYRDRLKQALRRINIHFDKTVKEFGFIQNKDEPYVCKKVIESHVTFLVLYVDDI